MAEAVWDLKESLESRQSGLVIRIGQPADVVGDIIKRLASSGKAAVSAVWVTHDVPFEEKKQQERVSSVCANFNVDFTLIPDEKYFVDECVLPTMRCH